MYGLGDQMAEDRKKLIELDNMVTIAKKSLEEISEIGKGKVQALALAALLKIELKRSS